MNNPTEVGRPITSVPISEAKPRFRRISRNHVRKHDECVLECHQMEHCIAKICEIIAQNRSDRRSLLQLGYNLGRLSELSGSGREVFWDRWKEPVAEWNRPELERLVQELPKIYQSREAS